MWSRRVVLPTFSFLSAIHPSAHFSTSALVRQPIGPDISRGMQPRLSHSFSMASARASQSVASGRPPACVVLCSFSNNSPMSETEISMHRNRGSLRPGSLSRFARGSEVHSCQSRSLIRSDFPVASRSPLLRILPCRKASMMLITAFGGTSCGKLSSSSDLARAAILTPSAKQTHSSRVLAIIAVSTKTIIGGGWRGSAMSSRAVAKAQFPT